MSAKRASRARLRRRTVLVVLLAAAPAAALDRQDLPRLAPLAACPEYGAGFAKVPGGTTCVRVSGRVAAGTDAGSGRAEAPTAPVAGRLAIDSRTDTDYGPLRSFVRIGNGRR